MHDSNFSHWEWVDSYWDGITVCQNNRLLFTVYWYNAVILRWWLDLPNVDNCLHCTPASSLWSQLWFKLKGQSISLFLEEPHLTSSITIGPLPAPNLALTYADAPVQKSTTHQYTLMLTSYYRGSSDFFNDAHRKTWEPGKIYHLT